MKDKIAKITDTGAQGGGHFFWPKMFPDQQTMDTKKIGLFDFLGFFLQFRTPYYSNF